MVMVIVVRASFVSKKPFAVENLWKQFKVISDKTHFLLAYYFVDKNNAVSLCVFYGKIKK